MIYDDLKVKIYSCFFNFVIHDPYPELTSWDLQKQMFEQSKSWIDKILKVEAEGYIGPRPEINAHKAWHDGFEFAKSLVMKELNRG